MAMRAGGVKRLTRALFAAASLVLAASPLALAADAGASAGHDPSAYDGSGAAPVATSPIKPVVVVGRAATAAEPAPAQPAPAQSAPTQPAPTQPAPAAPAAPAPAQPAPAAAGAPGAPSNASATTIPPLDAGGLVNRPVDVMVVLDLAERENGPSPVAAVRETAGEFVRRLPEQARIGIATSGSLAAISVELTPDRQQVMQAIAGLSARGDGPLFDAVSLAADQFDTTRAARRVIVAVADGRSRRSLAVLDNVRAQLASAGITFYAVHLNLNEGGDATALESLAKSTGGSVIPYGNRTLLRDLADELAKAPATVAPLEKAAKKPLLRLPGLGGLKKPIGALAVFGGLAFLTMFLLQPSQKMVPLILNIDDTLEPKSAMSGITEKLAVAVDKSLEKRGKKKSLEIALERAGINLRTGEFLLITIAAAAVLSVVAYFMTKVVFVAPIAFVFAFLFCRAFLNYRARKRKAKFGTQLGDVVQLLSSSLRAGQGLVQALDTTARDLESPGSDEFRRVVLEARLGRDLVDSLRALAERMQSDDMEWLIPAIEINRSAGGDLAEVLDNVGATIRDRADIRRQVKTLSAEGRLSAYVLLGLPIVIGGFVKTSNPTYLEPLFHGTGLMLLGAGGVLMTVGAFWLMKLCRIEF